MTKYHSHRERWGEFVDVKINLPQILSRELPRAERGIVLLSSVTDPYQPVEEKYELTRKTLQRLLAYNFPVSVLTKSALVARDADLLSKFPECEVGLTITTLDEGVREGFEPHASGIRERLDALKTLSSHGVKTYAFLGPLLPFLIEDTLDDLAAGLEDAGVSRVLVDRLNIKYGNWDTVKELLVRKYPQLLHKYEAVLFNRSSYFEDLKEKIAKVLQSRGLSFSFCY